MNTNTTIVESAKMLGATAPVEQHAIRIYVPSHDRDGLAVDQATWVERIAQALASAAGGVTVEPSVKGGWLNRETGKMIWESPIPVVSYFTGARTLSDALPSLHATLHEMGRALNQGEVGVELDGYFLLISKFDGTVTHAAA